MSVTFRVEGFRDMERALADMKAGTAKGVTRRALKKVLQPVADTAAAMGPFDVRVTSALKPRQRKEAREDFARSVVAMYVGPVDDKGKGAPHAHLIEFGTGPRFHKSGKFVGQIAPAPFMRPAWDMHKPALLDRLGQEVWGEIEKAIARAERKAARAAAAAAR